MDERRSYLPKLLIGIYLIPTLFPFYWMLKSALETPADVYKPRLWLGSFTLENFTTLLKTTNFLITASNSLQAALISSTIVVVCSGLGGYALARTDLPRKALIAQIVLFSYMFPEVLLGIPFFGLFQKLGLLNSIWGLAIAHVTLSLPFGLWLMWQFYQALPKSYEEAAEIDGATKFQTFLLVMVPLSIPRSHSSFYLCVRGIME